MAAALWDLIWDLGGGWNARLSRRDPAGTVLAVSPPAVLEVRHIDEPSSRPAELTVTANVPTDGADLTLAVTAAQIAELGAGRFEHRILMGTSPPSVLLRGYLTVRDTMGG